jgi:hypothetical protein
MHSNPSNIAEVIHSLARNPTSCNNRFSQGIVMHLALFDASSDNTVGLQLQPICGLSILEHIAGKVLCLARYVN